MNRQILVIIAAMIFCNIDVTGQKGLEEVMIDGINYTYDNAGNRISRIYVEPPIMRSGIEKKIGEFEDSNDEETLNSTEMCEIQVYPNPVKDELFVEIQKGDNNENYRLMFFDSAGKMLKEGKRQGNGRESVDLSLFPTGVYFLIINTQDGKWEYKIVKE